MQSPKFYQLENELNDTFSRTLMKDEWKKRVKYQIRKQLIFDLVEYRDYQDNLEELISDLRHELLSGRYTVFPPKRYLVEKSKGLTRQMTLVHPRDLLVLERLSRSLHYELKEKAPSDKAYFEPDQGEFSKGFQQQDLEYGSFASWKKFQTAVFGFANENDYVVVTDVANFYDFINFSHLRNIVASLADVREAVLDLLIYVLSSLSWTPDYMPATNVGMPQIETSATRVLANALLYEVDGICETHSLDNYARFMDDIDVGIESVANAKKVVRDVDLTLQSRQLRLNSSKTKILSAQEAHQHFCIQENFKLTRIDKLKEKYGENSNLKKYVHLLYESWMERDGSAPGKSSPFNLPNGSKIHKRMLYFIHSMKITIPYDDLLWLVEFDPSMRDSAFRYLAYYPSQNLIMHKIEKLVRNEAFVDDASLVGMLGYALHARFKLSNKLEKSVSSICCKVQGYGDIGLYCALLLGARFLGKEFVLKLAGENQSQIKNDYWLARTYAGLFPIFCNEPRKLSEFVALLRNLRNEDAERVFNHLQQYSEDKKLSLSANAYLSHPNSTFPQKIYYPKLLALIAACSNENSQVKSLIKKTKASYAKAFSDPYYKKMGLN